MISDAYVPGRVLCRKLDTDFVRPALDAEFPDLPYATALLGRGSEVLGYDDAMSADHNVEPRVLIFLTDDDHERCAEVHSRLDQLLPPELACRPTQHRVTTIRSYLAEQLQFDIDSAIRAVDWLTWPEARLIMITGGVIFHDEIGLTSALNRFDYYPDDVWYYLMLAGWWRVHPEVNLTGRVGYVGDELGSAIIAAGLVKDLMRLCFLVERRYAPYEKWFGSAFRRLECGPELVPIFSRVLETNNWQDRERALQVAYEKVAALHNDHRITDPVPTHIQRLWDRPFPVLWGDFPAALRKQITDPEVARIADAYPVGGIDRPRETMGIPRDRLLRLVDGAPV